MLDAQIDFWHIGTSLCKTGCGRAGRVHNRLVRRAAFIEFVEEVVSGVDDFAVSRWSIAYYEKTANEAKQSAMDRQAANGGLGEYYSEGDTRVPTWMVAGDAARWPS